MDDQDNKMQDTRAQESNQESNQMWGGRFQQNPDALMEAINVSIDFDKRFYAQDIKASKAHASMLAKQGILTQDDADLIIEKLDVIKARIDAGTFEFSREFEDIHMNVEAALREEIGDVAGRLHTARSRNDQVATDMRLYMRDCLDGLMAQVMTLQSALVKKAKPNADMIMPGFTHLQTAQPVTFGHHLMAYVEMLERDRTRLQDARARLNENPLGSAALAGTPFPIDRDATSQELGFDRPTANSLDAVSDRDFILETLSALSIMAMHLSRFAEEIVIWSSAQFNFIRLSDKFSTGSSIMPQKRNPDAAELIRAKIGRILGAQNALMVTMKGLPLAYSKDMQEDKELTFDALDTADLILAAMTGMVEDMEPVGETMLKAAGHGYSTATDLADWLVRVLNIPFREAHHITGAVVALAEKNNLALEDVPLDALQGIKPEITEDIYAVLSVEASVASRTSYGGTAPDNVKAQFKNWQKRLGL